MNDDDDNNNNNNMPVPTVAAPVLDAPVLNDTDDTLPTVADTLVLNTMQYRCKQAAANPAFMEAVNPAYAVGDSVYVFAQTMIPPLC